MKKQLLAIVLGLFGLALMTDAEAYARRGEHRRTHCSSCNVEKDEKPCTLTCENKCGPKPCCYTVHTYKKFHKPCACTTYSCPEGTTEVFPGEER